MPRPPRLVTLALISSVALLTLGPDARGWGRIGHRASARLAETMLTPRTRAAVAAILGPGESLADASTWPDEHRRERPESAPWHYVNVPISSPRYDAFYCPQSGCVVSKIGDFRAVLKDPKTPPEARREALRFLVHFVQDMHQPVHVGDRGDRGGNDLQVQFFGEGSNLHRVWDSGLIERAVAPGTADPEAATLDRLRPMINDDLRRSAGGGTVESWADESLAEAREAYVDPDTHGPLRAGAKLGDTYQAAHIPAAERRLVLASIRLARLLNDALDAGD